MKTDLPKRKTGQEVLQTLLPKLKGQGNLTAPQRKKITQTLEALEQGNVRK